MSSYKITFYKSTVWTAHLLRESVVNGKPTNDLLETVTADNYAEMLHNIALSGWIDKLNIMPHYDTPNEHY